VTAKKTAVIVKIKRIVLTAFTATDTAEPMMIAEPLMSALHAAITTVHPPNAAAIGALLVQLAVVTSLPDPDQ